MGKATKVERYVMIEDGKKRFLDVSYYPDGTIYFNLRGLRHKGANATEWNAGSKLCWIGNAVCQWVSYKGKTRPSLRCKANEQELNTGAKNQDWQKWNKLFEEGAFKCEAVIQ